MQPLSWPGIPENVLLLTQCGFTRPPLGSSAWDEKGCLDPSGNRGSLGSPLKMIGRPCRAKDSNIHPVRASGLNIRPSRARRWRQPPQSFALVNELFQTAVDDLLARGVALLHQFLEPLELGLQISQFLLLLRPLLVELLADQFLQLLANFSFRLLIRGRDVLFLELVTACCAAWNSG